MDTITINRILQNLPPDARRDAHEAFDEQRRTESHLEQEVLSKDPEMGLDDVYSGVSTEQLIAKARQTGTGRAKEVCRRLGVDMHEPDDLPFSDVDPGEMMLREVGAYDD